MLLWKRYGNNKMAAMRIMSLILHLQQYSHRLNFFFGANILPNILFSDNPVYSLTLMEIQSFKVLKL